MNLLIIGAGRMGVRHCQGAMQVEAIERICLIDINDAALSAAQDTFQKGKQTASVDISYQNVTTFQPGDESFDIAIIASTVTERLKTLQLALDTGCKYILVEKPLGQSLEEVKEVIVLGKSSEATISVNLCMRMYDDFRRLKNDLASMVQFKGDKIVSVTTGTLGIGANGIHYLDLLSFVMSADKAKIVAGDIESTVIPSGRGPQFEDYGGWCTIEYYNSNDQYMGRAHLSMASTSTAFGGWDIIGPHGRIRINEIEQERVDILRDPESRLPLERYAGDYLEPVTSKFAGPFLGDLTRDWIQAIVKGENLLPSLEESLETHRLLFDWLSLGKDREQFSFT